MKKAIKNKAASVEGYVFYGGIGKMQKQKLTCIISNDENGKTLSINDEIVQLTIPFEPIERYLK